MNSAYWQASRSPRYSLLFAGLLLIFYKVWAAAVPAGPQGGVRNGADVMLQAVFIWLAGSWGPRLFMACLIIGGLWLVAKDLRSHPGPVRPPVFGLMLVEAEPEARAHALHRARAGTRGAGQPPRPTALSCPAAH